MNPADTEALKALVALARKFRSGRWMTVSDWNRYAVMEENHPHERFVCTFNQKPISMQGRKMDPIDYCGADKTTAEFIAASKNAIPAIERMLASQTKIDPDEIARAILLKLRIPDRDYEETVFNVAGVIKGFLK